MDALRWENEPSLHAPTLVAAFEGWTDAGGAASGAAAYLADQWHARQFATIDAEEFYDFTSLRPQVRLTRGRDPRDRVAREPVPRRQRPRRVTTSSS